MVIKGCGGIILKDNQVLLFKRHNTPLFDNMWSNPGGTVEPSESLEHAVVREMKEEIGVIVKVLRHLADYRYMEGQDLKGIFSGYFTEIVDGTPRIVEPHKASDLRWFPVDGLPDDLAPYTKLYLDALRRER